MKASRCELLPGWICLGSIFYFLGSLIPLLGIFGLISVGNYPFLGFSCEFPPHEPGILLLQLVQIFFGLTGLALLFGCWAGVRMGLVCGYLGLGIRLTHDAVISSSLEAILQFDTALRIYFIIALNQLRPAWESAPAVTWRSLVYGPPEEEVAVVPARSSKSPGDQASNALSTIR